MRPRGHICNFSRRGQVFARGRVLPAGNKRQSRQKTEQALDDRSGTVLEEKDPGSQGFSANHSISLQTGEESRTIQPGTPCGRLFQSPGQKEMTPTGVHSASLARTSINEHATKTETEDRSE
jgi:hypothetical protein